MTAKKTTTPKTAAKKASPGKAAPKTAGEKKKAPGIPLKKPATKNRALAFVNWSTPLANGEIYKSSKGFPIFNNEQYPNPQEDMLVKLAREAGGVVELQMLVRISVNNPKIEATVSDFLPVTPA